MKPKSPDVDEKPILTFPQKNAWATWLDAHHDTSSP
jgi:hypothetical protein